MSLAFQIVGFIAAVAVTAAIVVAAVICIINLIEDNFGG